MTTPLPLTTRRATLQTVSLLIIFYGYIYGNAMLRGSASLEQVNLVASVFVTGALMLFITAFMLRRDVDWRDSLQVRTVPVVQAIVFGAVGVVLSYGAGALALGAYSLLGPDLKEQLSEKLTWVSKLGTLPLYWIIPISIFVGLWEEIVFRGFLLSRLKVIFRDNTTLVVIVVGVLFGLGHGYQGLQGILQTAAVGMALTAITLWRKSLWPAVIAHFSIDTIGLVATRLLKPLAEDLLKKV